MNHELISLNNSTHLTASVKVIMKNTAKKLTGYERRTFEAEVTNEFYNGNAIKNEREFELSFFL